MDVHNIEEKLVTFFCGNEQRIMFNTHLCIGDMSWSPLENVV